MGRFWLRMSAEIFGRSGHHHFHVRRDPHSDHFLVQALVQPDACAVSLFRDIDETGINRNFDIHVGVFGHQAVDDGQHDMSRGMSTGHEADSPRRARAHVVQRSKLRLDAVEGGAQGIYQPLPRLDRETERVVRVRSRTSMRSSNRRATALTALCDVPSRAAARVKLRSSATAKKAIWSLISSRRIHIT